MNKKSNKYESNNKLFNEKSQTKNSFYSKKEPKKENLEIKSKKILTKVDSSKKGN